MAYITKGFETALNMERGKSFSQLEKESKLLIPVDFDSISMYFCFSLASGSSIRSYI